jgi:hypothetical protein
MSFLGFGKKAEGPTKIQQVQINQSNLGYPVPIGWGRFKIQQSLLWVDGFSNKKVSASGSKGIGGGKGGTQYVYSANVIAALLGKRIRGIGDVWSGQSWLPNTVSGPESYAITGGTPTYTPANADGMTADLGVATDVSYTSTVTDLESGTTRTLSGSSSVPFQRVDYGTTLTAGTYSIDPATNVYHFAAADAGKTVHVNYSFSLSYIQQQLITTVPSGKTVSVGGTLPFKLDVRVEYYTGVNNGKQLTKVSGSGFPSTTGTYTVSGSGPATYKFATGDINAEILITYRLDNSSAIPTGTQTSLSFSTAEGDQGQSPWSLVQSKYPGAALGYSGIANVLYSPMDLGYSGQIQQNTFEVITEDGWGGGIADCNPVACILDILTNKVWGLGGGGYPFPLSAIDNGTGGTWGPGKLTGTPLADGSATAWFAANGFFISQGLDKQDTAASVISRWLEAGMCAAFMSEGLLKLVPYGDTTTAGNGVVWTAPQLFASALDDTCFDRKSGNQDPVKFSTPQDWMSAWNTVTASWNNRANQYAQEATPESDQAAIDRYGERKEDPQSWDFITTLPAATFAASLRVKRSVYTRNQYTFCINWQYAYLEPMDVVYLTTSSLWAAELNNLNLGVVSLPVRITKVVDNPDGTYDVTAEDYPFGVHEPTVYNKDLANPTPLPNIYEDPGDTIAVVLIATPQLADYKKNQLWIAAAGEAAVWGSCNVWISQDGVKYDQVGEIEEAARIGALAANFALHADPDTTNSMVVKLADNSPQLDSGSTDDADQNVTLCAVGGELVSFSTVAITGPDTYTASGYIRRGLLGTAPAAHLTGALFARLDDAVWKYTFDPSWAGKTIYIKLQSVNRFGKAAQDLSLVTPITFVPSLTDPGVLEEFNGTEVVSTWGVPRAWIPPKPPSGGGYGLGFTIGH